MSWRIVTISRRAKLDLRLNSMVVRSNDEIHKISLNELDTVVIESTSTSITTALMVELIRKKIRVIICDEKHNPISELLPYYGCHDSSKKIRLQMEWTQNIKDKVWQQIIKEKIKNQYSVLFRKFGADSTVAMLRKYATEVEPADCTKRESLAAKAYFPALFGKDFQRKINTAENAALNYGYQIIVSLFSREIKANGYLTELGIFHNNQHNYFNLSSDLMEPFRPIVDEWVYDHEIGQFTTEEKRLMQRILDKELVIRGRKQLLNNTIKIYTKSVFDALNKKDCTQITFFDYEQ